MSESTSADRSLSERLKDVRIEIRRDLEISRHVFAGQPSYILRDPVSFQGHRLSAEDYSIVAALSAERTLDETWRALIADESLGADDEEAFYSFIVNLQRLGMLSSPFTDGGVLYSKYEQRIRAKRKGMLASLVSFRIPLFNPDRFLDRSVRHVSFLFTRWFFAVWLALVACCLAVVIARWSDFSDSLGSLLASSNLPILWATLIGLKMLHEFGHAYACKRLGGRVPEMGVLMICLTPCAYVDASASWGFPRRRQRIAVGLGGIYFESIAGILATVVWALTQPGMVHACAHQAIVLASVVTVGFNINPLMRYDGYYIFSDVLGLPNLRKMSTQRVQAIFKSLMFGIPLPTLKLPTLLRMVVTGYGIAAMIYKPLILFGICAVIAIKFHWAGVMMAVFMLMSMVYGWILKVCGYLWKSPEVAHKRSWAVALSGLLFVVPPTLLMAIPVPGKIHAVGLVGARQEQVVRLESAGFVEDVPVVAGQPVTTGTVLLRLRNRELEFNRVQAEAELRQAVLTYRTAGSVDHQAKSKLLKRIEYLENVVDQSQRKLDQLQVVAGIDGTLVRTLDDRRHNQYVTAGEPLATVVSGTWIIKSIATADDLASSEPQIGSPVECRFNAQPATRLLGRIEQINPAGSQLVDYPALTQLGGGQIAVDPDSLEAEEPFFELTISLDPDQPIDFLQHGMVANVRLTRGRESIGRYLYRQLLRFTHDLMTG